MYFNPLLMTDGYKLGHREQYPEGTTLVMSNFTARGTRRAEGDKVVFFGLQYLLRKYLVDQWGLFFKIDKRVVVQEYYMIIRQYLNNPHIDVSHIEALHDLGYLPIEIWALPEGTVHEYRVPSLVIYNTHPSFAWLTNYLETIISCTLWPMCTTATTAYHAKKKLIEWAEKTTDYDRNNIISFVDYAAHDFSMRGMFGLEASAMAASAHAIFNSGSDGLCAIDFLRMYYDQVGPSIHSIPASEHSVMCCNGASGELETIKRLLTEVYPDQPVSIVSDSYDYFNVIENYARELKDIICNRQAMTIFRPDSGDPMEIIPRSLEILWDIYGGSIVPCNGKEFKIIDPIVGLIWGDGIRIADADPLFQKMADMGFSSVNLHLGVGSYTYQYVTRDTDNYAIKTTYAEINGRSVNIKKEPKTDSGMKHSATGITAVYVSNGKYVLVENATWEQFKHCELKRVFSNSRIIKVTDFNEVRSIANRDFHK